MTNINIVENKISAVEKYLNTLERYKKYSQKEIESDVDIKGAVERYLYLAVQAAIDLAESAIAYKNFRKPSTMSEAFYILNEEKIISAELAEEMVKMTGFRNVIAHDYEKLDYNIVYNVLHEKLKDIEGFLNIIKQL